MEKQNILETNKIKWLRLELTNACNFNCSYCAEQFMTRKKGFMDINLAKRVIDEVSSTGISDIIGLQFMGEGLLYPKFSEVIFYANKKGVRCKLITNGSLLSDKNINDILDSGMESIYISYFTSDEYSYQLRRAKNITYEEYHRRVRNMIKKKIEKRSPIQIAIGILNTKYCFLPGITGMDEMSKIKNEIISLIEYVENVKRNCGLVFKKHDIERIWEIPDFVEYWTYPISEDICIILIEVGTWANQLLIKMGVKVTKSKNGYCSTPFEQLFIAWDGTCTCCCLDYDCRMKVGNIKENSIAGIWNNEKYKIIRDGMNRNELVEPYCQICRGKINLFSFLMKTDKRKLLNILFSKEKLLYLINRGWRRFNILGGL